MALDGGDLSASHTGRFTPGEKIPGTHFIEGWVDPTACLDAVTRRKFPSPCRESNPGRPAHSLGIIQHFDVDVRKNVHIFYHEIVKKTQELT
jgi:hypothetical protein